MPGVAVAHDLAPALARAVGHPVRVRLLGALGDGPASVDRLVEQVGASRRSVLRHLSVLERAGLVERTGLSRGSMYRRCKSVSLSDADYGALASTVRQSAVAAALAHLHTTAVSALEHGGFDRDDIHFSQTQLDLTEEQWRDLADGFASLLEQVESTAPAVADHGARMRATATLMLFERPPLGGPDEHGADHEPEPFSLDEGLDRAWQLNEQLDAALTGASTDWAAVVGLADGLRVVARAALAAEVGAAERTDGAHRTGLAT
jgi:DNA-binding transcriptional ArsR family regulator